MEKVRSKVEKRLVLMCEDCGRLATFQGKNADEIIQAIDASGWEHSSVDTGLCPDCQEAVNLINPH